jgi:hypothetical protein
MLPSPASPFRPRTEPLYSTASRQRQRLQPAISNGYSPYHRPFPPSMGGRVMDFERYT